MAAQIAAWVAVVVIAVASTLLPLSQDWRWSLGLLALEYAAAFVLILQYWPLGMAAVKLITGWIATAAPGMTRQNLNTDDAASQDDWLRSGAFKLISAVINVLIAVAAAPRIGGLIPGIGLPLTIGSLLMIGMGLLQLGM